MSDDAFFTLLSEVDGGDLVWGNQNAPRAPKPFGMLRVLSASSPFRPTGTTEVGANGLRGVWATRAITGEVQFFGLGAVERAETLRLRMTMDTTQERASALGIAIAGTDPVARIPAILNDGIWEERAMVGFTGYDYRVALENVGVVERVEIVDTEDGGTITVSAVLAEPETATAGVVAGQAGV